MRRFLFSALAATAVLLVVIVLRDREAQPVRIGVLLSLTGTMASSEAPLLGVIRAAVAEVNREGVLGHQVEVVVRDGGSNARGYEAAARGLLDTVGVSALFGCWTSECRKTVEPVVADRESVLFYPLQYEGAESSPYIVYLGAAPNQQIIPAVRWAMATHGPRVFLVGSDYIFPRTAHRIIREYVARWRGTVVGEAFLPLGAEADPDPVVERILETRPDVILSTINGAANPSFFRTLRGREGAAPRIPAVHFSVSETELAQWRGDFWVGDFAAWTYFRSLDSPENQRWLQTLAARFGQVRIASDPSEAAYTSVMVWAGAVEAGGSVDPASVRAAVRGLTVEGPGGIIHVDSATAHTWKVARIGQVCPMEEVDGCAFPDFRQVWASSAPVKPVPYPATEGADPIRWWTSYQDDSVRASWNGGWSNPDPRIVLDGRVLDPEG